MKVRLLTHECLNGAQNMAIDEAIQRALQRGEVLPTLRFYQWKPACLSLGYFQDLEKDVDMEALTSLGVDVVRRITGGKAVLHDDELTYSITVPEKDFPGSVLETYVKISKGLAEGLRTLGINAELSVLERGVSSRDPRFRQAACFSVPSWYEIVCGDKKLVGSAQSRKGGVILQHGSIPFSFDAGKLVRCLKNSQQHRERAVSLLTKRATGLSQVLGRKLDREELESSLVKALENVLGWEFVEGDLTMNERREMDTLVIEKYGNARWNLERGHINSELY